MLQVIENTGQISWLGGRDSEPFAPNVREARRFPRDVPSSQTSELMK
jgi:hypothetical protein